MATIVLTAVGTAIGGPIGGAIGAVIGQYIDREVIFAPKGRQGPRMNELAIQTSSYGSAIPKIFGTMRVAGTVIWAGVLREKRSTRGGGKGQPSVTTYSYAISFAVLLSARPIRSVGRIWADGALLRGAAGDFKTSTRFRLYTGGAGQAVDPLIAAVEGAGAAPAYRGMAYAVFENFQLGEYGNRIPSLSFEVIADAGPVGIGAIAEALSDGAVTGDLPMTLGGYAASGDSVRGAIETLAQAAPLSVRDDGARLVLAAPDTVAAVIEADALGARVAGGDAAPRIALRRGSALTAPYDVSIAYYDPSRDYQPGLQRAIRSGEGRRSERIAFPATLSAGEAKAIAEAQLLRGWTERQRLNVTLPWRHGAIAPGALVRVAGVEGIWRVAGWAIERMVVSLALVRWRGGAGAPVPAEPGRGENAPDLIHGPSVVHLIDIPWLGEGQPRAPQLGIVAAGVSPGWRRAAIALSDDDGARWRELGVSAPGAVMGRCAGVLGPGFAHAIDMVNAIEVVLLNSAMDLNDADAMALAAGENFALVGDEIIQFGRAEPLGGGRYRLSRLLRGRRGSEWAIEGHAADERFVLLSAESVLIVDAPAGAIGRALCAMAAGVGDDDGVIAVATFSGESVRPPSPVCLGAAPDGAGGFVIRWVRRSRTGWQWSDHVDAPIGEEREAYRVTVMRGDAVLRVIETGATEAFYTGAMAAADRAGGAVVSIGVVQIGAFATSRPARMLLDLGTGEG